MKSCAPFFLLDAALATLVLQFLDTKAEVAMTVIVRAIWGGGSVGDVLISLLLDFSLAIFSPI